MRRLLLILLMLIMTTQWTWAAVASACQHESGQASRHIGHHEHKHEGAASGLLELGDADADPSQPDAQSLFVLDADCATCHVGALALLAPGDALAPGQMQDAALTPYLRSITHGVPERLIRPPHLQLR